MSKTPEELAEEWSTELWIAFGALVVIGLCVYWQSVNRNECEAKGGVYLRSNYSSVCMKGEVIK
jgi:hypothetical protein